MSSVNETMMDHLTNGFAAGVETCLNDGADADYWSTCRNTTVLNMACNLGNNEVCRILLKYGANPESNNGNTNSDTMDSPLIRSIKHNRAECVAELISAGADVNRPDSCGWQPLLMAFWHGSHWNGNSHEGPPKIFEMLSEKVFPNEPTAEIYRMVLEAVYSTKDKSEIPAQFNNLQRKIAGMKALKESVMFPNNCGMPMKL